MATVGFKGFSFYGLPMSSNGTGRTDRYRNKKYFRSCQSKLLL